MIAKKTKT